MRKILLISRKYPPSIGGMQSYSRDLVKHLGGYYDINAILLGRRQINLIWFLPYAFIRALLSIMTGKYEVLYLCDGLLAPIGALLKYITGIKTIITVHGLDITYKNRFYQALVPRTAAFLDKIICVSNSTIGDCVKRGVEPKKCVFIPNGVDFEDNDIAVCTSEEIMKKYFECSSQEERLLLSVGRLVSRKGIAWFIENIFCRLDKRYRYVVVGDGPERSRILKIIEDNSLSDRVKLLGEISDEDLKGLYGGAYALIMPNLTETNDPEGFGIVILESARSGLPVIAHNVDGINDAVLNGLTGWLVPEGDKEKMISRIENVELEKHAVKEACVKFDWKNIVKKYAEEVETVISEYPLRIFSVTMTPVSPPFDDGPKNIVYGIAKRLSGFRFYFISSLFKSFPYSDNIRFIKSPFQRRRHHSMSFAQKIFVFFAMMLNIGKVDIFQFFFTPNRIFSSICGRLMRKTGKRSIQVISSIHTLLKGTSPGNLRKLFFADEVITQTDHARRILETYGVPNVTRIYPGIDLTRYDSVSPDGKYVSGFGADIRYILYPGNYGLLKEAYSFRDFCRIMKEVLKEHDNVMFIMACRIRSGKDIVLEKEFKDVALMMGLEGRIVYLNTIEDMPSLMALCTLGILPVGREMSRILELPLVAVEMSAMGKPFIYGKVNPLEELMDKRIGTYPENNTPGSYSALVNSFLSDEILCESTGNEAIKGVKEYFDIDRTAVEYKMIYDRTGQVRGRNGR